MAHDPDGWRNFVHGAVPPSIADLLTRELDSLSPDERRQRNEYEARSIQQPFGWNDRVYLSVTGLRWRCCGNL